MHGGRQGAGGRDGVYHEFCRAHNVEYMDFRTAKVAFGGGNEFAGVVERALAQATERKALYDVVLVDEAQDFRQRFFGFVTNY